ncbi:MAG TPA: porin [Verrucomicrobiae bacterium]
MKLTQLVRIERRSDLPERGRAAAAYFAAILLIGALSGSNLTAQDTATPADELRALRQKVEELDQKLKLIENRGQTAAPDTNSAAQVEELNQKVKILERNRELDQEAAEAKAKEAPKITVGANGFGVTSADGAFGLQLKGVLQVDSRTFFNDSGTAGNDGILLRRARPILQGTVFRDFDFLFVPDFGGSGSPQIFDAYLNYRYTPALQLQAGKFKTPVGLEQLQADKDILFNERSLVTDLVPNRDLGFELHGDLLGGSVSYAAGIFSGIGDAKNSSNVDIEDNKSFAGRLFLQPFKTTSIGALQGLGFGVAGSYEDMQGTNTAGLPNNNGYSTVGQQLFFAYNPTNRSVVADGAHWRVSPQAYYYYGPFGLLGEYAISDQKVSLAGAGPAHSARLEHTAWQVTGSWVLTGEAAAFNGVIPRRNFNPANGGWGAWQLVARYSQLDIDPDAFPLYSNPRTSANSAKEWSVGLNWYLNRNVKVATSFSHATFDGGGGSGTSAPASVTRKDENVLFTRIQLAF